MEHLAAHRTRIMLGGIIILIAGALALWHYAPSRDLSAHADDIIRACEDALHRPTCYDEEIPKLMDTLSMEEAFTVTRLVQERDTSYWYCHVLGHNLSAREAAKDPSRWSEVIARCPVGMCSNGCLHGAFQERFREETLSADEVEALVPELREVCESSRDFTSLERASCYHALGHLSMYITGADLHTSLEVCDRIALRGERDWRQLCYDGAFMQIFQPLEPEDIALVQDIAPATKRGASALCAAFSGVRFASCHAESWPLYEDEILTPEGAVAFCGVLRARAGAEQNTRCLNALFNILSSRFGFDGETLASFCGALGGAERTQCFANAASRMIETDYRLAEGAAALCATAPEASRTRCFEELLFYSTYNFHAGSDEWRALCEALPGEWRARCFEGDASALAPQAYQ
ncbi:hypothetical protein COU20_00055 [Candidatus Kaiserbacteria bacterium CG10_big_fil_rev_8_21_14_0_10_59_10]|uniref:Uncharacterized protein n=1 Tax=Candidatus Kaiserbacteria bacterium CG10_big_fil_rev_8_21_14_0_10_59_10 TaxID=1974612 RepID=A0A2H0U8X9_9BACT|nr:MAG: hypothetical protein COU20_00055 [Candidatus Kaiserbacteria bacterium CG10_big_fil_rev_8_21_14_0_10_59_10]